MQADPNTPLLDQVIGYLGVEAVDRGLPEWRRSRAAVLVARLEKLKAALAQTERELKERPMEFCQECCSPTECAQGVHRPGWF